jgi:hypothetical protein
VLKGVILSWTKPPTWVSIVLIPPSNLYIAWWYTESTEDLRWRVVDEDVLLDLEERGVRFLDLLIRLLGDGSAIFVDGYCAVERNKNKSRV